MIENVHVRDIDAPAAEVGSLLAHLGSADDRWWPAPAWIPMVLDRPLGVGADGGHGDIRYHVTEYEPNRRARFDFHPACGLVGYHELMVEPLGDDRTRLRHEVRCEAHGLMRATAPIVERLHDAVLEDLLDNAEREATGTVRQPAQWSLVVRVIRPLTESARPSDVAVPSGATLARDTIDGYGGTDRIDLLDTYSVPAHRTLPADPQVWADAIFRSPPRWVTALMALRQLVVGFVGIERGSYESFATRGRTAREVVLGTDAGHLDFRASVYVSDDAVAVTTIARTNNRRGRLYLKPVGVLHPWVVRSMLARAHRRFVRDTVGRR